MSKTPAEKRTILAERTAKALGISVEQAIALLQLPRKQSIRLNTLRGSLDASLPELGRLTDSSLKQCGWMAEGYAYSRELSPHSIRDSHLAAEGKVFIQNAASWLPVLALDPQPGETILDVCAAPGGKTSHIAAITNNKALVTANDNSRPRLAKMQANFARLGVENVELTLYDATQLARKLEGRQFDKILLDAPCSGEGMLRYDSDKDFASWSVAHIKRLQRLQKHILTQAWQLLKPGGTLVYSTCTIAPEENEAVIDYLLRTRPDAVLQPIRIAVPNRTPAVKQWNGKPYNTQLEHCMRLIPSEYIEAFFVCSILKTDAGRD